MNTKSILSFLALLVASPATADIYKYTAPNGIVYYSDQPPNANYKRILRVDRKNDKRAHEKDVAKKLEEAPAKKHAPRDLPKGFGAPDAIDGIKLGASRESLGGRLECQEPAGLVANEMCGLKDDPDVLITFDKGGVSFIQVVVRGVDGLIAYYTALYGDPKSGLLTPWQNAYTIPALYKSTKSHWWEWNGVQFVVEERTFYNPWTGQVLKGDPAVALRVIDGD